MDDWTLQIGCRVLLIVECGLNQELSLANGEVLCVDSPTFFDDKMRFLGERVSPKLKVQGWQVRAVDVVGLMA